MYCYNYLFTVAAFRFIEKQFSENMEIDSVCVEMSPPADGIARSLTLNLTISDISGLIVIIIIVYVYTLLCVCQY